MLPIIVRIITLALGSVLNKGVGVVRNSVADKLKDGDVTDENWRDAIVEDLDDIKAKIDGLSRKDLLASHCFLKEGIDLLIIALDEVKDEQTSKDEANGLQDVGSTATTTTAATAGTATTKNESDSVDLNEAIALSNAIQKLRNASNDRLVSAKECFKAAREEATRAFCNEALKLSDRIMAAKIRVVSKILECLQDTKAAASGCMLFLKELNHLPAIGETFSTYFNCTSFSSFKSKFYKEARLENMKSVLSLNLAVSEFVAKFSGELPNVRNWPRIHLPTRGETIHPLLLQIELVKRIFDSEKFQRPENHVTSPSEKEVSSPWCMNSKGELIAVFRMKNVAFTLERSGELKRFCHVRRATANVGNQRRNTDALAVDRYDNLYVILHFPYHLYPVQDPNKDVTTYVLLVFDSSGNEKCEKVLDFIQDECSYATVNCVVNKDGDVIIHFCWKDYLYVCDSNGNLKSRLSLAIKDHSNFQLGRDLASMECVTDQNELILVTCKFLSKGCDLLIYTKEGEFKRKISNLKHSVYSVTYNSATSKIEILGVKEPISGTTQSYSIFSYSETGDVECLYLPIKRHLWSPTIVSHPAGPAALVCNVLGEATELAWPLESKVIFI